MSSHTLVPGWAGLAPALVLLLIDWFAFRSCSTSPAAPPSSLLDRPPRYLRSLDLLSPLALAIRSARFSLHLCRAPTLGLLRPGPVPLLAPPTFSHPLRLLAVPRLSPLLSYNKYIQIAARATRTALKEEERVIAEKRGSVTLKWQTWKDGKGSAQVSGPDMLYRLAGWRNWTL